VIAHRLTRRVAGAAVRSATSAGKLVTLLAIAPLPLVGPVVSVVETTTLSRPRRTRLGKLDPPFPNIGLMLFGFSHTCGGVGHLSRDCGEGPKCYNCSGYVRA
jgi:hypothetical protein